MALVEAEPGHDADRSSLRVNLSGDLDLACVGEFTELLDTFAGCDCQNVDLDLDAVGFCDSSGLSMIVHLVRATGSRGGRVTLHRVRPRILRLLSITGVDQLVVIADATIPWPPDPG